jgi:hypothetical protein
MLSLPIDVFYRPPTTCVGSRAGSLLAVAAGSLIKRKLAREERERSVPVMQCGLAFLLFLVSVYFGVAWQRSLFGIAMGFGVFAGIELVAHNDLEQWNPALLEILEP